MDDQTSMECPVCLNETSDQMWCGHSVCNACAKKWFDVRPVCPTCKRYALGAPGQPQNKSGLALTFPIGITVTTAIEGVRVIRLDKNDSGYKHGIRTGDVITFVNGLRVKRHEDLCGVLRAAEENKQEPVFVTVKAKRKWSFFDTCFTPIA